MNDTLRKRLRALLTALPIAASILVVFYLVTHKPEPARKPVKESVRTLRVMEAPSVDLVPMAVGFGVAGPGWIWEAVAEVRGTIISIHPRLKSGELVKARSVLIRIEPTEYELAIARIEASIEETRAHLKELAVEEDNTRRLIEVENHSLSLAQKSLDRKVQALERNAVSQDEVDREERNYLQQKQRVRQLKNTLTLMPSKRRALNATLNVHRSSLEQARMDLSKTIIKAPYDCRLGDLNIETGQFVRAGQSLFKAHGIAVSEVEARFRIEELRHLLDEQQQAGFYPESGASVFAKLFKDFHVVIKLESGDWASQWEGRIDRLREGVDVKTREIKVVTAVDAPYEKAIPGVRPPLSAGMFCRVEIQAPERPGSIVVPRAALHDQSVFILDPAHRLQKKQVEVDFLQSEFVIIKSGLSSGETVVVSDPSPAIIGMKVSPVTDKMMKQRLLALIRGNRGKP